MGQRSEGGGKKIWNMPKPCMTCTQNMSRNAKVKKTGTKGREEKGGGNNEDMPKTCMTCTQDMSRNAKGKENWAKGRMGGNFLKHAQK
jgi:hypothetical protein